MTQTKGLYHRPTESLIQQTRTKFYPLDIPVPHPQLRNFISTVDAEWLYYASGYHIYTLHLPTQRTQLLITVPFSPRCLAAGLGWVCVGGERNGDCAFVQLNGQEDVKRFQVDARLPVDLPRHLDRQLASEEERARSGRPTSAATASSNERCFKWEPDLLVHELGGDIVNSITVHELQNKGASDWNEPVALLSNNDKTVKIYSLLQQTVIADLLHPFPMNHAVLSPDSTILAAVGDGSRAFFYRRKYMKKSQSGYPSSSSNRFPKSEWELFAIPDLPVGDHMNDDHSFAVTFSPSGHLCAISSQGGMISVFDMDILGSLADDEDPTSAVLCMFKSSRAAMRGCIRSMVFSPPPWDLLAWAEDHGRVGVADVRQGFCRRQVLDLDFHSAEKVEIEDVTPVSIKNLDTKGRLIHQYRQRIQSEYGRPSSGAGQSRQAGLDSRSPIRPSYYTGSELDARERAVLDTLEMTMDEIYEATLPPRHTPYSLTYGSVPRIRASVESERMMSAASGDDQVPEQLERLRSIDRSYLPRRRNSVVLSRQANLAPQSIARNRLTASPSRLSQSDDQESDSMPPPTSTNDPTPTARASQTQPMPYTSPTSDPWHVIQSALEAARASDNSGSAVSPSLTLLEAALTAERRLSQDQSTRASNSAQTSALPTIRPVDPDTRQYLDESLQRARDSLRLDPERQLRRHNAVGATAETNHDIERHQRILEARSLARQRVAAANAVANGGRPSRTDRWSELSGRVSDTDMRLARLMMMSGGRHATDGNGNWIAGEALERLIAARGGSGVNPDGLGGSAAVDFERELGLGTAGLTWSPDGRYLFAGTEEGVFQYQVNLADRRTFPTFAFM